MAGRIGAPSKMNLETITSICGDIAAGVPMSGACGKAGISPMTADRWRETGWSELEAREDDDTAPMTLHMRFVIELEAAKIEFQSPLLRQWQKVASGDKGATEASYRAARDLLAATDPTRWSERVAAAGAGKLQLSGGLENSTLHHFERMSYEELDHHIDQLDQQIRSGEWSVMTHEQQDAWIAFFEDKVERMKRHREGIEAWKGDLHYRIRRGHPVLRDDDDQHRPMMRLPRPIPIDLEATPAADTLPAPTGTSEPGFVHRGSDVPPLEQAPVSFPGSLDAGAAQTPAATAPASPSRARSGFGPGKNGQMVPMFIDANGDVFDEDVVL